MKNFSQLALTERIGWSAAALVFVIHAALANRYDFFRDELYLIICGRHPALGYVDQPPLVPLISAATQAFGENLVLLRLFPTFFAAAMVFTACALARLGGGGPFAVTLTALFAGGFATMFLGLQSTFNTTAHEPLAGKCCKSAFRERRARRSSGAATAHHRSLLDAGALSLAV